MDSPVWTPKNQVWENKTDIPQQLETLGVLPIKLRDGLGQWPETWQQVHHSSTFRLSKVPHLKGSIFVRFLIFKVSHKGRFQIQFNDINSKFKL